ncbi:MAG: ABC transporter permease [Thermomicrobiales bacterium]|nr:ABC transporter permease [Thermomicrobiales bacterium]
MVALIARSAARALLVLLTVATIVFGMIHLSGDPLAGFTPPGASPEQQAIIRERLGLDRPLPVQYAKFIGNAATGDFGDSWRARRPALAIVLERLPATARLAGLAMLLAVTIGGALGYLAARRPGGPIDAVTRFLSLTGQALPAFWAGTMLILLVAVRWKLLPSSGSSVLLPAITLALYPIGLIARLLRGALIESSGAEYARTARSKGLSEHTVSLRHLLPNAVIPVLGFAGVQASFLLGGAVVVETVFAYPGLGRLAMQGVVDRDLPVVQAFVVVLAAMILAVNLVVETLAGWIDPRLRDQREVAGTVW